MSTLVLFNYVIWNLSPEIPFLGDISEGYIAVRWYGLLFALGFLFGQWIFSWIFTIEKKPAADFDRLLFLMIGATVIGARLGHVFFYGPYFTPQGTGFFDNPLNILKIWEGGLASHGAGIAMIAAIYWYSSKRKDQSFFWVADRMVIVVALGGALIRMGNLMNSEMIGLPSNAPTSFVFTHELDELLKREYQKGEFVYSIKTRAAADTLAGGVTYIPLSVSLYFDKSADREPGFQETVEVVLKNRLLDYPSLSGANIDEIDKHYRRLGKELRPVWSREGAYAKADFTIYAVPRHPAQLYEAIYTFLTFLLLLFLYNKYREKTPEGLFFGLFMTIVFSLRIVDEALKENQVPFEDYLPLNMGQILSLPAVAIGLYVLLRVALKARQAQNNIAKSS